MMRHMNNYDGLLPEISNDHNIIQDFNCNPGTGIHKEHSIIMKLNDALQLCMSVNSWDQKLIGQKIEI